jgi:hypothetical protein
MNRKWDFSYFPEGVHLNGFVGWTEGFEVNEENEPYLSVRSNGALVRATEPYLSEETKREVEAQVLVLQEEGKRKQALLASLLEVGNTFTLLNKEDGVLTFQVGEHIVRIEACSSTSWNEEAKEEVDKNWFHYELA